MVPLLCWTINLKLLQNTVHLSVPFQLLHDTCCSEQVLLTRGHAIALIKGLNQFFKCVFFNSGHGSHIFSQVKCDCVCYFFVLEGLLLTISYGSMWWRFRWFNRLVVLPFGAETKAKHCLQCMVCWAASSGLKPKKAHTSEKDPLFSTKTTSDLLSLCSASLILLLCLVSSQDKTRLLTVACAVLVVQLAQAHLAVAIPNVTSRCHRARCELWHAISLNIIGRNVEMQN